MHNLQKKWQWVNSLTILADEKYKVKRLVNYNFSMCLQMNPQIGTKLITIKKSLEGDLRSNKKSKIMIQLNCMERFLINVLKQAHIPQHISFIMDGNRRYALSKNKESYQGHEDGKQSLKLYLLYCLELGVKEASFFCFSIENFKRSQKQVSKLMQLIINTFDELSQVSEFVLKKNVKVKIIGNINLFEKEVSECLRNVQQKTKNNKAMTVNLCFAYDSIHEINSSIQTVSKNSQQSSLDPNEFYRKVYKNLQIQRPVDILVRTSNQSRLSNFMLMQNSYSLICILKQNWPQINLMSLAKIIFQYNMHYKSIQKNKSVWLKTLNSQTRQNEKEVDQNEDVKLL